MPTVRGRHIHKPTGEFHCVRHLIENHRTVANGQLFVA
jgi:hypothetical protein